MKDMVVDMVVWRVFLVAVLHQYAFSISGKHCEGFFPGGFLHESSFYYTTFLFGLFCVKHLG